MWKFRKKLLDNKVNDCDYKRSKGAFLSMKYHEIKARCIPYGHRCWLQVKMAYVVSKSCGAELTSSPVHVSEQVHKM